MVPKTNTRDMPLSTEEHEAHTETLSHIRRNSREAMELQEDLPNSSFQALTSNASGQGPSTVTPQRRRRRASSASQPATGHLAPLRRFWRQYIAVKVPHNQCRDHLALERTFLAYLRTSLGLAMAGVTIDQLFALDHSTAPDPMFGFYVVGKPLAGLFIAGGLLVAVFGSCSFWRQQAAMTRGEVHVAEWELIGVGGIVAVVSRVACMDGGRCFRCIIPTNGVRKAHDTIVCYYLGH